MTDQWQSIGDITGELMRKLRAKTTMPDKIHDRMAQDAPINSVLAIDIVSDPYGTAGEQVSVVRSLRDDPIAGMYSRSQIDSAQFAAARKWQQYHEQSTIGPLGAVDPTRIAVDTSSMRVMVSDQQIVAFRELLLAHQAIGKAAARLIADILGARMTIYAAAQARGASSIREVNAVGRDFRTALETLAIHWGYAAAKRRVGAYDKETKDQEKN